MIFLRSRSYLKAEVGRVTVSERLGASSLSSSVSVFSREKGLCEEQEDGN
jgi:hypothetical protein